MRLLRPRGLLLGALMLSGCSGSDSPDADAGVMLTVEYESLLDVRSIDVFGQLEDGSLLEKTSHPVPLSLDPPGLRQVELVIAVGEAGPLTLRADGLDADGEILGSGRGEVTVVAGALAPLRIVLGAPVRCGDGDLTGGAEECDDGNALAGDGCSPTCAVEPGWQCNGRVCTQCGNEEVEPGEMCDDGNGVSGDGCSDRCMIEGDIRYTFEVEQLETQTTTSADWVVIPGTSLTIAPNAASETWMIFASGKLRSTDAAEVTAELRLMIDGTESDLLGHQTTGGTDNWAGFITFDRIESSTATVGVHLELRAAAGTTEADDLRIVAARVPASADFQFLEVDEIEERNATAGDLGTLRFTPSFAGDYLVLAKLNQSELPSADTVRAWLEHDTGARHPDDPNGTGFSNGRASWAPIFVAFSQELEVREHAFTLRGSSSASGNYTNWWDAAWDHRVPVSVASTGTITPAGYSIAVTFDHASMVAAGQSLAGGSDVRVVYQGNELDRVLDPDSSWDRPDTTIWFAAPVELAAGDTGTAQLYFGNPRAGPPPEDPALVFPLFDDFEGGELDAALWSLEGGTATPSGGELALGPQSRVLHAGAYFENTIWEVRSRLSTPIGARMVWLGGAGENASMSWFADDSDHHAECNGVLTHFDADTPTDFHLWRMHRSGLTLQFSQDETAIASCQDTAPRGRLQPYLANETESSTIYYDWIRIRTSVTPEPEVSLGAQQSIRGGGPSRWSYRKIMAFRADAFDSTEYAESLVPQTTTATTFQLKTELTSAASPVPRDYLSIQSLRISGANDADARKSGELRAGGEPLLATSHKINRTSEDPNGYHHVAGAVDLRTADAPVLYQNGFSSPDGITVRAAESVIIVLAFPSR